MRLRWTVYFGKGSKEEMWCCRMCGKWERVRWNTQTAQPSVIQKKDPLR